ncbi:MAG: EpsG family protein [Ruminococcus sp.]|nr:EpsG family protein [Ruminococcus sp.]
MTVYYVLMLLIAGLAYPMYRYKPSKAKNVVYVCIVFGYMLVMSVLRYGIGNDYFNYRRIFYSISENGLSISQIIERMGLEPGYALLIKAVQLCGGEYFALNAVTAALIIVPTAYVILKYSKMPWLSAWLYLTVTFFYNSLNFTRQSISVAIIFLGWRAFRDKKHIFAVLVILAASMFHISSLVLLPVYFMSLIKPSAKSFGLISAAGLITFVFSSDIISFVTTYILPRYAKYADQIYLTKGFTPKFLIIPALLMLLTMSAYFTGWREKSPYSGMLTWFSFYNFLIWIFITKHFVIERFSMPIYIFILIAIPEVLEHYRTILSGQPKKDSRRLARLRVMSKKGFKIYPICTALVIISTFIYNNFCINQRVHGVFPYTSVTKPAGEISETDYRDNYRALFVNSDLMQFLGIVEGGDYTVVLTVNGYAGDKLEYPVKMLLKKIGFETDITSLDGKSLIAVARRGEPVFERTDSELITESVGLYNGKISVQIASGGSAAQQQAASVFVNGKEYATNTNGLNFAVFDNKLEKIVAAQSYDTSTYSYAYTNSDSFYGEILLDAEPLE